jgi:5-methylcytosine-specific restriction endonuclease McrA
MPYKDPVKKKEYMRNYQREWMRKRRQAWIDENGPCKHCGSTEKLEVDHINPRFKKLNPHGIWSLCEAKRKKELAKCQVLCKSCHLVKTLAERKKRKRKI